jgi:hypothetical protein
MKFILTNSSINEETLLKSPFKLKNKRIGAFNFIAENIDDILETNSHCSITDGYLRDLNSASQNPNSHTIQAVEQIQSGWPVSENITGSFSTTIIDKNSLEITLCNDLIGVYPLYYLLKDKDVFVSNSIFLMAYISNCKFDEVGIAQRCIGPEYSNMGSRTILKDCKRLLPGEYLKIDLFGNILQTKYDNSLYQNISSSHQNHDLHKDYWDQYKKEIDCCLIGNSEVNIALSGGMDSRLLLGAIPNNKNIVCLTYGEKDNYETKIASRIAKLKNAKFKSFSQPNLYFTSSEILRKYVLKTEAVNICSWLEILENIDLKERNPILLGDMTEAISARNIKKFSSRNFRQDNFIKHYLLGKDYQFDKSDAVKFEEWKKAKTHNLDRWYIEERVSKLNLSFTPIQLVEGLHSDLEEVFLRIESHHLPFTELYDELFSWYTHSRIPMGKQILICNSDFYSSCPPMSNLIIRNTSNIHPNLRLGNRFLNKLFSIEELNKLNKIPTSQAPFIPQNFLDIIKFPIWGLRSKIDHFLIKRLIKSKDPTKRYRLFKSINWVTIYQNPDMEKNLKKYFENNHLGEDYFNYLLDRAIQRKNLDQWPFANTEMINGASLNMEIDLIKSLRRDL